jgi:hypothetical protein
MKMITKIEYLKALEIVEQYHDQLRMLIVNHEPKLTDIGLKRGDHVTYIGGSESQYLTKGNKYRLTGKPYRNRICIINDAGRRVNLKQSMFEVI